MKKYFVFAVMILLALALTVPVALAQEDSDCLPTLVVEPSGNRYMTYPGCTPEEVMQWKPVFESGSNVEEEAPVVNTAEMRAMAQVVLPKGWYRLTSAQLPEPPKGYPGLAGEIDSQNTNGVRSVLTYMAGEGQVIIAEGDEGIMKVPFESQIGGLSSTADSVAGCYLIIAKGQGSEEDPELTVSVEALLNSRMELLESGGYVDVLALAARKITDMTNSYGEICTTQGDILVYDPDLTFDQVYGAVRAQADETMELTEEPTSTCVATISSTVGANVRNGPAENYAQKGTRVMGDQETIYGVSELGGWYLINEEPQRWVWGGNLYLTGNCSALPKVQPVAEPVSESAPAAPAAPELVRRTSGVTGSTTFVVGEGVVGYRITLENGSTFNNCYLAAAPSAGSVFNGVVNPWADEVKVGPCQ